MTTRPQLLFHFSALCLHTVFCALSSRSETRADVPASRCRGSALRCAAGSARSYLSDSSFYSPRREQKSLDRASHLDERTVAGEPRVQDSAANICKVAHGQRGFKALVDGSLSCTGITLLIHNKHKADNVVAGAADVSYHTRQTPSQEAAPHTGRRSLLPLMRKWPVLKLIQQTNIRG